MRQATIAVLLLVVFAACGGDGNGTYSQVKAEYAYYELLPSNYESTLPLSINNNRVIVGYNSNVNIGFNYNNGNYSELLPSGWYASYAADINDKGDMVGWGWEFGQPSKGFLYSEGKFVTVLPPGWLFACATAINNKGEIVGFGNDNDK